ncbi:suppressor protein SRP40-like [Cryptomeria japonica]|uniref:suppressor protein SRP40-like n=1 Tax=Cryptomeria japonica TaxID=3369 RepID=UPI0027DA2474|nr:suppressor protein SRP40-like [Cryptomeria japonica]
MAEVGAAGGNGRTQISNPQQGGNPGSNGGSGQIKVTGPIGDKDKPLDIPKAVVDLQSDGTLPEETAGSSGLLGEGSNGGPIPCDDSVDSGREKKKCGGSSEGTSGGIATIWNLNTVKGQATQIARMQSSMDSDEEMSDSAFSEEEESDSDSSSDKEDNFDDSEYESEKKRKYRKIRPSSSKGKKPQSKPLTSISLEGEDLDDSEKENPKGLLKKKTKIHT